MSSRTNHLDQMGSRYIGRKGRPAQRATNDQCDYRIGAQQGVMFIKRTIRKPGEHPIAQIPVLKGGTRCKSDALVRKPNGERRCLEHLTAEYPILREKE